MERGGGRAGTKAREKEEQWRGGGQLANETLLKNGGSMAGKSPLSFFFVVLSFFCLGFFVFV